MPQLDITSFTSQILWLVTIYFTFYILLLKYVLPKIGKILKFRKNYKINKILSANEAQSKDLTKTISTQLNNLVNTNHRFFSKNDDGYKSFKNSEMDYLYVDPSFKEQQIFLKTNLESLFIKKQLLEKYSNEKNI